MLDPQNFAFSKNLKPETKNNKFKTKNLKCLPQFQMYKGLFIGTSSLLFAHDT